MCTERAVHLRSTQREMPSAAAAASGAQSEETIDAIFLPIASAAARCLETFGLPQLRCSLLVSNWREELERRMTHVGGEMQLGMANGDGKWGLQMGIADGDCKWGIVWCEIMGGKRDLA